MSPYRNSVSFKGPLLGKMFQTWSFYTFHVYHRGFHKEEKRVPLWRQAKEPFFESVQVH